MVLCKHCGRVRFPHGPPFGGFDFFSYIAFRDTPVKPLPSGDVTGVLYFKPPPNYHHMKFLFAAALFVLGFTYRSTPPTPVPHNPQSAGKGIILLDYDGYRPEVEAWGQYDTLRPAMISDSAKIIVKQKVEEYFNEWDVLVTTNDSLFYTYPQKYRVRVTVTASMLFTLRNGYFVMPGGISFYNQLYLGDTTTCLVSTPALGFDSRAIADGIAHEVGHSLGLAHISDWIGPKLIEEYSPGDSLQAPIMGVSYRAKKAVWTKGTNAFGQYQDDREIIAKTWCRKHL